MQTIITPAVHSESEHSIVALLSKQGAKQATQIQARLVQAFGDVIWLQQSPSLHITLMEIINDTDYHNLSREQHFRKWYENFALKTKETLANFAPFTVIFTELVVSEKAIIIKAVDPKPFNLIREALLDKIRLPEGTTQPPDITHCSLARFSKAIELDEARRLTSEISVNFTENITEFSLVKDLGPPDFNGSPMEVYPLLATPVKD